MIKDALLALSINQPVTVTAPSSGIIDVSGAGVGNPAPQIFGVQSTVFGEDIGGGGPAASSPQLGVSVGTAFTASGSATLQIQLQAAIDDGTNNPSTWRTIAQTDTIAKALLTAGQWLARFNVPNKYPGQGFPRFYRCNYVVATGPMLTGSLYADISTGLDDVPFYPSGF